LTSAVPLSFRQNRHSRGISESELPLRCIGRVPARSTAFRVRRAARRWCKPSPAYCLAPKRQLSESGGTAYVSSSKL